MSLKVIGAGFGRTGTTSLKAALEQLGFSKCHHMQEVMPNAAQRGYWQTLAEGGDISWDDVFDGYESSCDWPSAKYWEELSRYYPDAKIVLSVRDEAGWYDSVAETIYPASFVVPGWLEPLIPLLHRFNKMIIAVVWNGTFDGRFLDRAHALKVYRDHNAHVKATVPAERLLVFEARDGWAPLCRFLDVPVPDSDYPHLNDAAQIRRAIAGVKIFGWISLAGIAGGVLALVMKFL